MKGAVEDESAGRGGGRGPVGEAPRAGPPGAAGCHTQVERAGHRAGAGTLGLNTFSSSRECVGCGKAENPNVVKNNESSSQGSGPARVPYLS